MLDIIIDGKKIMSTSDDGKDTIMDQKTFDMFTKHMTDSEKELFMKDRDFTFNVGDEK